MLNRAIFKREWREHLPRTQVPGWTNDANGVLFLLLFLSFFLIYIFTLSPDVLPADAGEFQAVVPLLGVAHPPGFPLYILLGKAFLILFPFLTPARALNLFSALTGALTLLLIALTVRRFARSPWPGLLAAAALGVSTTFWAQSTAANIRSLAGLFVALCLWSLSGVGVARGNGGISSRVTCHVSRVTFFFLSLAILHHGSLVFMGIVFIIYWLLLGRNYAHPRRWLLPIGLSLAPLVVLLYLPLRAAQGAYLAPSHLTTLPGFLEHVLATGFEGDFFYYAHFADLPDRLAILGDILSFQFNPLLLALFALGLIFAFLRDWRYSLMLLAAFVVNTFVAITYRAPQTVEYMLPAYVVMAVSLGIGLSRVTCHVSRLTSHLSPVPSHSSFVPSPPSRFTFDVLRFAFAASVLLLLALATASLFARNLPSYRALAHDRSTREYSGAVLQAAPQGAVVLANWHWSTPMWYLQKIEGLRPDVEVVYVFPEGNLLPETWVRRIQQNLRARPVVVTSFYPFEFQSAGYRFLPLGPAWEVRDQSLKEVPPDLQRVDVLFEGDWRLAGYRLETASDLRTSSEIEHETEFRVQFRKDTPTVSSMLLPGESAAVTVAWHAAADGAAVELPAQQNSLEDISFFVQLIGPDGALYAQADFSHPAGTYEAGEILVDRGLLTLRLDAMPGDYELIAGAFTPGGTRLAQAGQDFVRLATVNVGLAQRPSLTRHPDWRSIGSARLLGHDFDLSLPDRARLYLHWRLEDVPQRVVVWSGDAPFADLALPAGPGYLTTATDLPPGQPVTLTPSEAPPSWAAPRFTAPSPGDRYLPLGGALILAGVQVTHTGTGEFRVDLEWLSARPLVEDYIVKVDLVGPDQAWKVGSDSVPAGGAIPTLKWLRGSLVRDRHRLAAPVPGVEDLAGKPGLARLQLAVYDHFTERVLPILDPGVALLGGTAPLGQVTVP